MCDTQSGMRILCVTLLIGCGHAASPAANPQNTSTAGGPSSSPLLVTDAPMNCEGTTEDAEPGNHDRYAFETPDGLHGYKDGKGNVVIAPTLRFAYEFKPGGIAAVVDANGRFHFIDLSGKPLARAFAFDNGPDYFQEGFARIVGPDGTIGFISDRGVIPAGLAPRFERAQSFCHGKATVIEHGVEHEIDRTGTAVK